MVKYLECARILLLKCLQVYCGHLGVYLGEELLRSCEDNVELIFDQIVLLDHHQCGLNLLVDIIPVILKCKCKVIHGQEHVSLMAIILVSIMNLLQDSLDLP